MFCDLAGSTKLSGQIDPEDLRDVIRACQSSSAEVIERFDGYLPSIWRWRCEGCLVEGFGSNAFRLDPDRADQLMQLVVGYTGHQGTV